MLLTEFDENKVAILNPSNITNKFEGMPKTCVSFFEYKLFEMFLDKFKPEIITSIGCAVREHPIYKVNFGGKDIAVMQAGIGEPYCVSNFEEVIELGVENILLFGSCGSLIPLNACSIIVPYAALRDEGTSYHYAPPSDEIELDKKLVKNLCDFFDSKNIKYQLGKTWTTDAFYRETKQKVEKRKNAGAICVEMECAGMAAMAKFRNVNFMTFFYTGDNLSSDVWDIGSLSRLELKGKDILITLALEAANSIFE